MTLRHAALAALLLALAVPTHSSAQLDLTGYALGVGTAQGASDFGPSGSTLFTRTRLMVAAGRGGWTLDVAYEHLASRFPAGGGGFSITNPGGAAARAGDWLGADWEIHDGERSTWRHRFDRLGVAFARGPVEVTLGRQAVSWATTLVFTPADPFAPFDPSDPFREYRGGVDALRIRAYPGPFTEIDAVVRPTETAFGTTWSALGRFQTSLSGWALGGWGGMLHDAPAGAVFLTGAFGATAIRSEAALREAEDGGTTVRAALGIDRFFTPGGKDLYLVLEAQYDGFGTDSASNLLEILNSKSYQRGELQSIGRLSAAATVSYQLHPIVGLDGTALVNLEDGSVLFAPGVSWSASGSASVRAGTFAGFGSELLEGGLPGSEYGSVPAIGYLSVSWYF